MNILTDEELREIGFGSQSIRFARAIEALLMSKLAERAGEPVAEIRQGKFYWNTDGGPDAWRARKDYAGKLYTEAQLIAAQQLAVNEYRRTIETVFYTQAQYESAQQRTAEALVEPMAKAIYNQWSFHSEYKEWVDGGNSIKQDEARQIARIVVESGERS